MYVVSAEDVKKIIDTDLTDTIIDAYILSANYAVTEILGSDTTLSDGHKETIVQWLAAHLIAATREQQIQKAGAGGANVTYQGMTGKGLEATLYGQQVLALDTTGKMITTMTKRKASLTAVTSFE